MVTKRANQTKKNQNDYISKDLFLKQMQKFRNEIVDAIVEYTDSKVDGAEARINEKINHLPTKEDFYSESAKLYKEVKDYREEQTILSHQVSTLADRVGELEN